MPGGADLAGGVAGFEEAEQAAVTVAVEAFTGDREQASGPIQRVALASPVAACVVLHPTADLVEGLVGETHDVERIGDLGRLRQHRVEHAAIGAGQVERGPPDPVHPVVRTRLEPGAHGCGVTASNDIEELAVFDIDDLRQPPPMPESAEPAELHLIQPDRTSGPDPVRVVDQRSAMKEHGAHRGVPIAAEIISHLGHRAADMAEMNGCPPPGPVNDRPAVATMRSSVSLDVTT